MPLNSFWLSVKKGEATALSSELTLLETLVVPIRQNNEVLIESYGTLLTKTEVILSPITAEILREAATLRAQLSLKTPDAIHAATAIALKCDYLITNDDGLRRLPNINLVVMSDLL